MIITADFQWKRSTLLRIFIENTQERYIFSSIAANIRVKNYWLSTEIKKPGVRGTASSGPKAEWHFDIQKNVGHLTQSRRKMWFKCCEKWCLLCSLSLNDSSNSVRLGSTILCTYVQAPSPDPSKIVCQHTSPSISTYFAVYLQIHCHLCQHTFLGGWACRKCSGIGGNGGR